MRAANSRQFATESASQRLEIVAVPSIGTVSDSFDNSIAEAVYSFTSRSNSFAGQTTQAPGRALNNSNYQPSARSTGATRITSMISAETPHRQSSNRCSMFKSARQTRWQKTQLWGLYKTRGGSYFWPPAQRSIHKVRPPHLMTRQLGPGFVGHLIPQSSGSDFGKKNVTGRRCPAEKRVSTFQMEYAHT